MKHLPDDQRLRSTTMCQIKCGILHVIALTRRFLVGQQNRDPLPTLTSRQRMTIAAVIGTARNAPTMPQTVLQNVKDTIITKRAEIERAAHQHRFKNIAYGELQTGQSNRQYQERRQRIELDESKQGRECNSEDGSLCWECSSARRSPRPRSPRSPAACIAIRRNSSRP